MNYARALPKDSTSTPFQGATPAFTSYQSQKGLPLASSVVTLNANTTVLNITTMGGPIIGKWGTASVTASNFDIAIPSNTSQTFVVPVSVMGTGSIVGANVQNGLYPAIALIATAGSASVLTAEY